MSLSQYSKILLFFCTLSFVALLFFPKKQPDLTVVGFIDDKDGIGKQSTDLIDALKNDLKINFVSTRHSKKKAKPKWGKVILFEEMLWWPGEEKYKKILSSDKEKSIRIAYSVWESSHLPQEWVIILNTHFDAVCVPSPFLVDTYKNSGVTIPIFELPLGLNLTKMLNRPLKTKRNTPMVFGNLSACSERKNHIQLIRAFSKAFGNDPNVKLRINCRYGEKEVANTITKEIAAQQLTNVIFTQFSYTQEEYIDLFKTIDCYVSPSKGEGFSIQPREAMALGIPVIATDNTGQEPICASGLVKAIKTPILETAIFPWGNHYGHYYNCHEDELSCAMKEVCENYVDYLKNSANAREWVKRYQYEALRPFYKTLLKPQSIVLGDSNKVDPDKITTTSQQFYAKCRKIN